MTGSTVHTGSNQKFSQGWDQIFKGPATAKTAKPTVKKSKAAPAKKSPRKSK